MRNKFIYFICTLYILLIFVLSFSTTFRFSIVSGFTILLENIFRNSDVNILYNIVHITLLIIVYCFLSVFLFMLYTNFFSKKLYVYIYPLLTSIVIGVLSLGIMSFFTDINFLDYVYIVIGSIIGVTFPFVIILIKNRNDKEDI